ncbi:metallophosphoesterase family protein [Rhodopseudomonas telluris]|uniref:Metallophosphoesterase family protein n=1 Tax=Rhodopseudomonas telluris TaxID=644215 RepID=A0ABV6EVX3_9BRAD
MALLRFRSSLPKPRLPSGVRIYAVGDIHGRADLLMRNFDAIEADLGKRPVARAIEIYLGDYVDRGPNSRGVLDLLIERQSSREVVCLKGNHEAFMLDVLAEPRKLADWRLFGGLPTLLSYGLRPSVNPGPGEQADLVAGLAAAMPDGHLAFLRGLHSSLIFGDYFFVHAGVRPGVALEAQRDQDLLWIRDEFLSSTADFGKYVVHGHTPVAEPEIRPNRINIDTGAYATGKLTLLAMQDDQMMAI